MLCIKYIVHTATSDDVSQVPLIIIFGEQNFNNNQKIEYFKHFFVFLISNQHCSTSKNVLYSEFIISVLSYLPFMVPNFFSFILKKSRREK